MIDRHYMFRLRCVTKFMLHKPDMNLTCRQQRVSNRALVLCVCVVCRWTGSCVWQISSQTLHVQRPHELKRPLWWHRSRLHITPPHNISPAFWRACRTSSQLSSVSFTLTDPVWAHREPPVTVCCWHLGSKLEIKNEHQIELNVVMFV